jgi:O-antigen/teichoic acid export membrane protein
MSRRSLTENPPGQEAAPFKEESAGKDRSGARSAWFLSVDSAVEEVGRRSKRGGVAVMGVQVASTVIRIASTAVLARLLVPEDFGLMAMVTAITVFAEGFKDLGLSDATVQNRTITHSQVSGLFWVNLCVCLGIAALLASVSPLIARFYREPRLTGVALGLSSTFVFSGLVIQHQALLRRQLRFGTLSGIQLISTAFGVLVVLVCAYCGLRYWALVAKEVSTTFALFVLTWIACRWRPGLPHRKVGLSALLSYGTHVTGFNVIVFLSSSIDRIFIGRFQGASWLGYYDNAAKLISMSVSQLRAPVNAVALPGLSALQETQESFRDHYAKMLHYLTFFIPPVVIFLAVFADVIVRLLLGPQWGQVVPLFRLLSIAAFIQPAAQLVSPALMACGKTRQYFWLGVFGSSIQVLCVVGGGLKWGATGVALGISVSSVLAGLLFNIFGLRLTPLKFSEILPKIGLDFLLSLIWGSLLAAVRFCLGWSFRTPWILLYAIGGVAAYIGLWLLVPGGKKRVMGYWKSAARIVARKNPGKAMGGAG